jgi:N-acetylmuramoyl-L-alanine amidase
MWREREKNAGTGARRMLIAGVAVVTVITPASQCPAHAATLRAVRSITAPDTTRLIVEFSAPVRHRFQRVAARPELGVPARLYVDFLDTRLGDAALPAQLPEGPLRRLRAAQSDPATTRLVLDVPGLSDFGAFPLPDPFRLIIDVRGTPRPVPRAGGSPRVAPPAVAAPAPAVPTPGRGAPAGPPPTPRRLTIVLDPGHGGKDPGAFGVGGVAEKDVVLAIARRLRDRLAATPGIDAVLTRDSDAFLALDERTARANAERADLFVSIHANASTNTALSGVETYYLNNTNDRATLRLAAMENGLRDLTGRGAGDRDVSVILSDLIQTYKIQESVALAENVQHALVSELGARGAPANDLGVKRGPFFVLVGAGMPCVLVEVSFLTHPEEGERLARRAHQEAIADGLLRGILRFVKNTQVAGNL